MEQKQPSEIKSATTIASVLVSEVAANSYNPNRMDEETFEKEMRSIQEHGFIDPITVREKLADDGSALYEIVDGEHRWRAAAKLGLKSVPAVNLGVISDEKAKKLTIIFNELKGRAQPDLLAKVIKDLSAGETIESLAASLPYSVAEMTSLVDSLEPYAWKSDDDLLSQIPDGSTRANASKDSSVAEQKVQIGRVHGNVPAWIVNELLGEYERSAASARSRSVEVVMRDWVARLKATAPTVAVSPEAGALVAPPARVKKKASKGAGGENGAQDEVHGRPEGE